MPLKRAVAFVLALALVAPSALAAPRDKAAAAREKAACLSAYEGGQPERAMKHLKAAREAFVMCSSTTCPAAMQRECTTWLAEVEAAMPSIAVRARVAGRETADVRVIVDGTELASRLDGSAIPVDPGEHRFRFEHPPLAAVDKTVLIGEGDKLHAIDVAFEEPVVVKPPKPLWPVAVAGGVGVVGVAMFAVLGISGASQYNQLKDSCSPKCDPNETSGLKTQFLIADVALGVGVVGLGVATYLFLTRRPAAKPAATGAVSFEAKPTLGGAVLSARGRF